MSKLSYADLKSLPSVLEEWLDLKEIARDTENDFSTDEEMEDNRRWVKDFCEDIEKYLQEEYK